MENIVEKINEQRIDDAAKRIDELPPVLKMCAIFYINGFIDSIMLTAPEKKVG